MRVSSIHVRALLEAVASTGLPADAFMREAGFDPAQVADVYRFVAVEELDRLTVLAVERTGDPAFGLRWGERSPMLAFDIIALLFSQAPSLRSAFETLLRCQAILGEQRELSLEEHMGSAILRFRPIGVSTVGQRVRTELALAGMARLFTHLGANVESHVRQVSFAYDRPSHVAEYARVFGPHCRFRQPVSGFEFESVWLDKTLPTANAELHQIIVAQAERVLSRVLAGSTLAEQLRSHLRSHFPKLPEMQAVARSLGMSERSLRRRLSEEGVSYSQIVQETQCVFAERLLRDRGRSIQQVASDAGFASATAFHRAFKRWTGKSPAVFRDGDDDSAAAERA